MSVITLEEVYRAKEVLKDVATHPELIGPTKLLPDAQVYLKPECLQNTGSFKLRGAYYKISQLTDEEKSRGVIACSAGNHAQGVALGAQHNGIKAVICLPAGAPISKVQATRSYGAETVLVPGVYDDAYAKAIELRDKHGYTFVHPFDDPLVIAGQGTIGLEILEQLPEADAIIVPIGGGGLISGLAFAVKSLKPDIKVYGVQAAGAASMEQSFKAGRILHLDTVATVADGIKVKEPGVNTFAMCREYVDDIVTVTEDEIAAAILTLIEKHKLVSEGAGAVSVAAAMSGRLPLAGKKVVCLVSGGNIDVTNLNRVITRGLTVQGRLATFTVEVSDEPGTLSRVCKLIAEQGGNVLSVAHERLTAASSINSCNIHLELETRNSEHIDTIKHALCDAGFRVL